MAAEDQEEELEVEYNEVAGAPEAAFLGGESGRLLGAPQAAVGLDFSLVPPWRA